MRIPSWLLKEAAEEEKRELEAKKKAAEEPPAPAAQGPTTPEEDLRLLASDPSAEARRAAAERLGRAEHGPAIPALALALAEDPDPTVQRGCDSALRRIAGRGFGDFLVGVPNHERVAIRRNWDWWWGLHREEVERAMAARRAAERAPAPAK
jgi:hypothetical protein